MSGLAIRAAYLPLADAAPLIVARELGFAADEGLALDLAQARSWASLRDLLAAGAVDAAQMLAPMAVARAMGLGPALPRVEVPMILSQGGQAVGAARALAEALGSDLGPLADPARAARRVRAAGPARLRVGVPFPFSTHALLMGRWLGEDIAIRTVPPPLMAEALAAGEIDLFCVGEPWGSVAERQGAGRILLPGRAIWAAAPDKVLAIRAGWAEAEPDRARALLRALWRAGRWLDTAANRGMAAEILARPEYLALPAELIERGLGSGLGVGPGIGLGGGLGAGPAGRFVAFHDGAASFPWKSVGGLIAAWLARRHGLPEGPAVRAGAAAFRSDLYRQHLREAGADLPGASMKIEGSLAHPAAVASERGTMILGPDRFFDGWIFDPLPPAEREIR